MGIFFECQNNCKRCTKGDDCQECGDPSDPSAKIYLVGKTDSSPICSPDCKSDPDFRYPLPKEVQVVYDCLECQKNTYYLEGSLNPPKCSPCDQGGQWIDEDDHNICKACGDGCKKCIKGVGCSEC